MNNCLKTQLKASISNPDLQKLNSLRFHFHSGNFIDANRAMYVRILTSVDYEASENVKFYSTSAFIREDRAGTLTAGDYLIQFPNSEGTFDFLNKFGVFRFIAPSFSGFPTGAADSYSPFNYEADASQFDYVDTSLQIASTCLYGKLEKTQLQRTQGWELTSNPAQENENLYIDIAAFAGITGDTLRLRYTSAFGDVSVLGGCAALTSLYLDDTNCSGELSTLLNSLKTIGSTRDIVIACGNSAMTYGGAALTTEKIQELNNGGDTYRLKFHIESGAWTLVPM